MFLLNGQRFNPHSFFELNGVQYPDGWFTTATPAERLALGIIEVPDPVKPDDRFFYIHENPDGTITSIAKDLQPIKAKFKDDIDTTCGNARAKYASKGPLVEEEYRRAYDDAVTFKAAGYTGTVPASVQTWATVKSQTTTWAADDVISTRNTYMNVLDQVRDIRLKSKAAIDAAATPEDILTAMDSFNTAIAPLL